MVSDNREDLVETFRGFSDEYLLERVRSGDLTDVAQEVAAGSGSDLSNMLIVLSRYSNSIDSLVLRSAFLQANYAL